MLLCLVAGYFAGKLGISTAKGYSKLSVVLQAILFIPNFLFVVGVHEAGHAFAGIWVGFDFRMYVIGPFMWEKEQETWKFKWNTNVNTAGGMVICLPTGTQNLVRRFSTFVLGGPVASLILTVLAWSFYLFFSSVESSNMVVIETVTLLFQVVAFLSFVIFIVTALPFHMGGFYTDGARTIRLLGGGEKARFEFLMLKVMMASTSGIRPKRLNMADLLESRKLAERLNEPFGVYILNYLHQVAFDLGNIEKAEEHLLQYINEADQIPEGMRNSVWVDVAFFYAYGKTYLQEAEKYWNLFKPSAIIPKSQILATEAAIAFLKNENELALAKIEVSQKENPNMMDKGVALALHEKLETLKFKIENYEQEINS
jgi:hypothetical protein